MTVVDRPTLARARATRLPWLHRVHPLAKIAAPLPMLVALFLVRDLAIPLVVIVASLVLLAVGTRVTLRGALTVLIGVPLVALVLSISLGLWVDAAAVSSTPRLAQIGPWPLYLGGWLAGLETGLRMVAIVLLAFLAGSSTAGADVVRALVQQLRVPYRFGYAALAAFRFVPRFRGELETIRRAHRVRGIGGRGPIGWLRGQLASFVPLLAAALRHADRVAIAMETRAFGYAEHRTERHLVPVRVSDWVFVVVFVAASIAVLVIAPAWNGAIAEWLTGLVAPLAH